MAISADDQETQARFRKSIEASFPFVSDPDAKLINAFGVKTPVIALAKRTTFVIDRDRRVVSVLTSDDAIDPTAAVDSATQACGI